jgi:Sir2- and TIR-associating SLOG family/SIR2-like domain
MHGDCRQPHDAVLTKDDYETYGEKREAFSTALRGDLVDRTFLFLGFSFTDPNIDYILARIRGLLGENQRAHYCVMKWPKVPKDGSGSARAEYEYQRRKLELRVADLSRYQIHVVMINSYDEVTEILRELNRRSHLKHVFVSGSAHDFAPLGKSQLETFCAELGREVINNNMTLVSGFGSGIGGAVAMGSMEMIYANSLPIYRVSFFPFPHTPPQGVTKEDFHRKHRESILSNAGFAVFVSGNRFDPKTNATAIGRGVIEEFEIGNRLGVVPIALGASGWAAKEIWQQIGNNPTKYYGSVDISQPLKVLGEDGRTNREYMAAIFDMIARLSR